MVPSPERSAYETMATAQTYKLAPPPKDGNADKSLDEDDEMRQLANAHLRQLKQVCHATLAMTPDFVLQSRLPPGKHAQTEAGALPLFRPVLPAPLFSCGPLLEDSPGRVILLGAHLVRA